jgi:uncharacterized protein (TIGR02611 family)
MQRLHKSWRELKNAAPGRRFQERYRRSHGAVRSKVRRLIFIGGGILVMAAGVFFLPAPGPGFIILFIGAGLAAQESLLAARALDWTEVSIRRVAAWGLRIWRSTSIPGKTVLVLAVALIAAAIAYAAYQLVFAR